MVNIFFYLILVSLLTFLISKWMYKKFMDEHKVEKSEIKDIDTYVEKRINRIIDRAKRYSFKISMLKKFEKEMRSLGVDDSRIISVYEALETDFKRKYSSKYVEVLYMKADILFDNLNYKDALYSYITLLTYTSDKHILYRIGSIYEDYGRYELALDYYKKSYDYDLSDLDLMVKMGSVLFEIKQYREAIRFFEMAYGEIELANDMLLKMAKIYVELNNYTDARTIVDYLFRNSSLYRLDLYLLRLEIYKKIKEYSLLNETGIKILELCGRNKKKYLEVSYELIKIFKSINDINSMLYFINRILEVKDDYEDVLELNQKYSYWNEYGEYLSEYENTADNRFVEVCSLMIDMMEYEFDFLKTINKDYASIMTVSYSGAIRKYVLMIFFRNIEIMHETTIDLFLDNFKTENITNCIFLGNVEFSSDIHKKLSLRPIEVIVGINFLELLKKTIVKEKTNIVKTITSDTIL